MLGTMSGQIRYTNLLAFADLLFMKMNPLVQGLKKKKKVTAGYDTAIPFSLTSSLLLIKTICEQ